MPVSLESFPTQQHPSTHELSSSASPASQASDAMLWLMRTKRVARRRARGSSRGKQRRYPPVRTSCPSGGFSSQGVHDITGYIGRPQFSEAAADEDLTTGARKHPRKPNVGDTKPHGIKLIQEVQGNLWASSSLALQSGALFPLLPPWPIPTHLRKTVSEHGTLPGYLQNSLSAALRL